MVTEPELFKSILKQNQLNHSEPDEEFIQLLELIKYKLKDFIHSGIKENTPAINPIDKQSLTKKLNLNLSHQGEGVEGVLNLLDTVLEHSVNSWSPNFCDKLYSSTSPIGVISELILGVLNGTSHVYHVSPCLIQLELGAGYELTNLVGYSGTNRGGLTFPGGSQSNFMAMSLARNLKFPSIKFNGYNGEKLSVFTPQHGHYSIDKAAISLGIGLNRVYKVPCHFNGTMMVDQLELLVQKSIDSGETPIFINASAGSTVLGAFDDFSSISAICKKYNIWFHIDGSWGGSIIFSNTHRHLLQNVHLSDSFTINPHKLLGVPVQCSYLLLQNRHLLNQAHTLNADYLFHNNNDNLGSNEQDGDNWLYSNMDLADGTVGCGRRPDGFKLFLTWRYLGSEGFTKRVDHALSCAQYFQNKIIEHPNFKLLIPSTRLNVCFYYLPSIDQNVDPNQSILNEDQFHQEIPIEWSHYTKSIINQMKTEGQIMIDYSPLKVYNPLEQRNETIPEFFRMVFNHPKTNQNSIDNLISEIHRIGQKLFN